MFGPKNAHPGPDPKSSTEALGAAQLPALQNSWTEIWRKVAFRPDQSRRPSVDAAENMVCALKGLERSAHDEPRAEVLRGILTDFCIDLERIEESGSFRKEPQAVQREVLDAWFSFRRSPHTWGDLADVIRDTESNQNLAPAVARELHEEGHRYLADLSSQMDPHILRDARTVAEFLGDSFHLLRHNTADILPKLAHKLFRAGAINSLQYLEQIGSYCKAPSASFDTFIHSFSRAMKELPESPDPITLQRCRDLRGTIFPLVSQFSREEIAKLCRGPGEEHLLCAPAILSRIQAELANGAPESLLSDYLDTLKLSFMCRSERTPRAIKGEMLSEFLEAVQLLPTVSRARVVQELAPYVAEVDWSSRSAQVLWDVLTHTPNGEVATAQGELLTHILASDRLTRSFCKWCVMQNMGYSMSTGAHAKPTWFEDRGKVVSGVIADILRARKDGGRERVSDDNCLRTLSVAACLGPLALHALPEIASLSGIPVVWLPWSKPWVLPSPFKGRCDSHEVVVKISKEITDRLLAAVQGSSPEGERVPDPRAPGRSFLASIVDRVGFLLR